MFTFSLQQPNIKQKFVALLKRFKVSDEVWPLLPRSMVSRVPGISPSFLGCTLRCPWESRFWDPPSEKAAKKGFKLLEKRKKGFTRGTQGFMGFRVGVAWL